MVGEIFKKYIFRATKLILCGPPKIPKKTQFDRRRQTDFLRHRQTAEKQAKTLLFRRALPLKIGIIFTTR